jgi:hypothetical protein
VLTWAAFVPTAYIATPEISAPATPAAIGFMIRLLLVGSVSAAAVDIPSVVPDRRIHVSVCV